MRQLEVRTETTDGATRVVLQGELDIASTPLLDAELEKLEGAEPPVMVIDLRGVEFMDSTGLRAMVAADARAKEAGRRLAIVRGSKAVERVFKLTRLDESLDMIDDPAALDEG
jgi:anti-sigma B factor antagonist